MDQQRLGRRDATKLIGAGLLVSAGGLSEVARAATSDAPWVPLFNGHDLSNWTFFQDGVGDVDREHVIHIRNRVLTFFGPRYSGNPQPGAGHIATTGEYSRFHLKLQYRWGVRRLAPVELWKRNSGLVFHLAPDRDRPWPDGVELNIQEGDVGDMIGSNTRAMQAGTRSGAFTWPPMKSATAYGRTETHGITRQHLRREGNFEKFDDWNELEIIALEDEAAFILNGRIVNTIYGIQRLVDVNQMSYTRLARGRIALQIQSAEISFKNIMIKELS